MIDLKAYKQSILIEAMHGQLTKQSTNDGDAEDLLNKIKAHVKYLVDNKKMRKPRHLAPVNKAPYQIPKNWKWVRLGDIGSWKSGSTPKRSNPKNYNGNIPWLKSGDLTDGYVDKASEHISRYALKHSSLRINPKGSVVMAMYGGTISRLGIIRINVATNQACCACIPYLIDNKFLFYYLLSQRSNLICLGEGGAQPNISRTKIINYPIPLPPLTEQHQIVHRINICFRLAKLINKNQQNTKDFISNLKHSLLQLAMQGKLTKQLSSDGDSKDLLNKIFDAERATHKNFKPLPKIQPKKILFKIPKNWKWTRLGNICTLINGRAYKKRELLTNDSLTPVLRVGNLFTNKVWYYSDLQLPPDKYVHKGDLIYSWSASFGPRIWQGPTAIFHYHIWKVDFNRKYLNELYLYYVLLNSTALAKAESHGTSMQHITMHRMDRLPVPLPPLPEQQRIVKVLKHLFSELKFK